MKAMPNYFSRLVVPGAAALLLAQALAAPAAQAATAWQDRLNDDYGLEVNGFIEGRNGWRLRHDAGEKEASIAEARMQMDLNKNLNWGSFKLKADFLGDLVTEEAEASLREMNVVFSPLDTMDVKVGRQVLTWGTGDMIFINDMFPKDWQSFFIGRDDEYLKAPADALKASIFAEQFTLDLAYMPLFNHSRFVSGERLSYYSPMSGHFNGAAEQINDDEPNRFFDEDEYALRLSKNIESTELAFYGYRGFWKEPEGFDLNSGRAGYPKLSVYGLSARAQVFGGILNFESGYYDSRENRDGKDWTGRNSEIRLLTGFEKEIGHNFVGAWQYYLEWMQDYDSYRQALPAFMPKRDEYRHMLTMRLTKLLMHQNLTLSLFGYYSPSDQDGYLRPRISYKIDDHWKVDGGGNLFWGKQDDTFWGRFKMNNNLYAGLRYSF